MEELDEENDFSFHHKTTFLSLTPSPSSNRRLSSQFSQPSRPVPADKTLAWVSLQGRIVNAEEASSARAIGLNLSPDELVSWEMFSPIHRILLVAVIAVAVAESRKNHEIKKLTQAVELRDQILLNMQQKLDNLCDLVNYEKDQFFMKNAQVQLEEALSFEKLNLADGYKRRSSFGSLGMLNGKVPSWDDMIQYELPVSFEAEQEERRMSGLSDWGSSAVSSAEIQMSTLALEEDIYHLNRECQEKEATIKELSDLLQSSDRAGSKRIVELEETIRKKNMTITKLKKDMAVLEQKVMYLTRTRRPSFQNSSPKTKQLPFMTDNVIYEMDSTTSHSSSDSDFSVENSPPVVASKRDNVGGQIVNLESKRNRKFTALKPLSICTKSAGGASTKSRPVDPLIDNVLLNGRSKCSNNISGRSKQSSATVDNKTSRKQSQAGMKDTAKEKRRVELKKRSMTNLE